MKQLLFFAMLFMGFSLNAQVIYTGFVDKYPIECAFDADSDGDVRGVYAYTKFDEPIALHGKLQKGKLTLFEKDAAHKNTASLYFSAFDPKKASLEGVWTNLKTKKILKITLTRRYALEEGENIAWTGREILQSAILPNKYFKVVVSKAKDSYYPRVTGVKIFERGTDKLLQKFDVDCRLSGFESIEIGDFNFDGVADFSVFEDNYAGANTSALYFLSDTQKQAFIKSDFQGTSLEFDSLRKRIFEKNQCCGGTSVITKEYKVEKNKMVLLKEHCFKWDDKQEKLVERKIEDCQ